MSNIKRRGFGSMDKARLQDVASLGGRRAQAGGKVHRWTRGANGTAAAAATKGMAMRKAQKPAPVEITLQALDADALTRLWKEKILPKLPALRASDFRVIEKDPE